MKPLESRPESLILNGLNLKPYQYKESLSFDKSLTIQARIVLSEAEYAEIGRFDTYVKVVRQGLDNKPRETDIFTLMSHLNY
jgi:hypothetical protein